MSCFLNLMFGIFSLASLLSFHSQDPSFFNPCVQEVKNWCGITGAYFSAFLLELFGIGAFFFPATFFYLSFQTYQRKHAFLLFCKVTGFVISSVTGIILISILPHLTWKFGDALFPMGGIIGQWVVQKTKIFLNTFGTFLVFIFIFLIVFTLTFPVNQFLDFLKKLFYKVKIKNWFILNRQIIQKMTALGREIKFFLKKKCSFSFLKRKKSAPQMLKKEPSLNALFQKKRNKTQPQSELNASSPKKEIKTSSSVQILPQKKTAISSLAAPPKKSTSLWQLPPISFLKNPLSRGSTTGQNQLIDSDQLIENSKILEKKFLDFGIQGEVSAIRPGPVITLYEFKPGAGIKLSRIAALVDDLSMALSAESVRILAPLPGKSVVGIEIPSEYREVVYLREFLQHPDFYGHRHTIPIVMGKEIGGQPYLSDLARMPHLLCAGQTGSGKSVFMNGLICSLLYRFTPEELKMILVDPKFIEFRAYQDVPHLLLPVVDDLTQANHALKWAVQEMERRYRLLADLGVRNLATFNQKIESLGVEKIRELLNEKENSSKSENSSQKWAESFEIDETGSPRLGKLPYIIIVIDELADLMMVAKKEVETSIARIAQKARAAGIHLIIATQRPSIDVITGLIKANLPSRVSFQLASYVDSKTILDRAGAERLLGQGDMLFIPPGTSQPIRLHGAFLEDEV